VSTAATGGSSSNSLAALWLSGEMGPQEREVLRQKTLDQIEDSFRSAAAGIDTAEPGAVFRAAKGAVARFKGNNPQLFAAAFGETASEGEIAGAVVSRFLGLGVLDELVADESVEEIWANGPGAVFVSRAGFPERLSLRVTEDEIKRLVERMVGFSGKRLDRATPFVDCMLGDGSRLHAVIPPVTRHWTFNLRKFVGLKASTMAELVAIGSLSDRAAAFLSAAVEAGLNIVVSGAVGSGKTTMLNCLASAIPEGERVVTCEEIFELKISHPDVVSMQCREPNLEGTGEIPLRRLVREALRMRPDRILIGEVRGAEAFDMLLAMNAGCAGMTSIHANTARETLRKLVALPLLAAENISRSFVVSTVASCIDLVVFCRRKRGSGERYVEEVLAVGPQVAEDEVSAASVFVRSEGVLRWTGEYPADRSRFDAAGIDLVEVLGDREGHEWDS
jgi:pilus assembly protein CpaF